MFHLLALFLLTGAHMQLAFVLLDGKFHCIEAASLHTENNLIRSNAHGDANSLGQ